ncbi:hypothetical protein CC2G_003486 [Coprinopsis cinerea AmutBmut pab1-1]|nr:hypothetical protein CC2G_003486 [Coprinopsis cinerea AmutBmut pab1-1]
MDSHWTTFKFRDTDIALCDVTEALNKGVHNLVIAKPASTRAKNRWNLINVETGKIAIINHAFVWAWGSPPYTGNFVPEGVVTPTGLPEGRMLPSYQCEISYAFNTSNDKSLYEGLAALEKYIITVPDFNPNGKAKSTWQSLENNDTNHRYIASAKLFVKRTKDNAPQNGKYKVPYTVHPWIEQSMDPATTRLVPNKDRPRYFCLVDERLKKLEDVEPRQFQKDDVIWMSFYVSFNIRSSSWSVEITPLELVRVGHLLDSEAGDGYADVPELNYQPIEELMDIDIPSDKPEKRKRGYSSDGEESKTPKAFVHHENDDMEIEEDSPATEQIVDGIGPKVSRSRRVRGESKR